MNHNNMKQSFVHSTKLITTAFMVIVVTVLFLYLPNTVDGCFVSEFVYLHGIRRFIISVVCLLFFNVRIFFVEIMTRVYKHKNINLSIAKDIKKFKVKVCLCAISLVFVVLSFLSINIIDFEDDGINIGTIVIREKVLYTELEYFDLFIPDNDNVYWGKTVQDSEKDYNYDVYLGKMQNIEQVIKCIKEKSGRQLYLP